MNSPLFQVSPSPDHGRISCSPRCFRPIPSSVCPLLYPSSPIFFFPPPLPRCSVLSNFCGHLFCRFPFLNPKPRPSGTPCVMFVLVVLFCPPSPLWSPSFCSWVPGTLSVPSRVRSFWAWVPIVPFFLFFFPYLGFHVCCRMHFFFTAMASVEAFLFPMTPSFLLFLCFDHSVIPHPPPPILEEKLFFFNPLLGQLLLTFPPLRHFAVALSPPHFFSSRFVVRNPPLICLTLSLPSCVPMSQVSVQIYRFAWFSRPPPPPPRLPLLIHPQFTSFFFSDYLPPFLSSPQVLRLLVPELRASLFAEFFR